jgi:hypothetical protein
MSNIENKTIRAAGARVAKAEIDAQKKPMAALFDNALRHVKTKEDVSDFCAGYADALIDGGIKKPSANVMKSRAARILKVMTATDKKLNDFHGITSPEQGTALVQELMARADAGGITAVYEALAPKSAEDAEPTESDSADAETSEPTETTRDELSKIMADAINRAHEHGYTNDEIKAWVNASL